jgi:hypothetical protein
MKFYVDRHFIYITVWANKHKEDIYSYYKLREEDLEEINKDWSTDFLIPIDLGEMSDPKHDNLEAAHKEHDTPGTSRRRKIEEVQDLRNASEITTSI